MVCTQRSCATRLRWWFSTALLVLMRSVVASAQPPLGDEFQVNTYTNGNQQRSAVAAAPAGDFVVAWSSNGSAGSDTSGYSIQARRYDANGAPVGDQFQVNSSTAQSQTYPAVATDVLGNFVIVWESEENNGPDTGFVHVRSTRISLTRDRARAGEVGDTRLSARAQPNSLQGSIFNAPRANIGPVACDIL